jgi:CubicO group peptidase (beta-lactamase class C family)
VPGTRASYSNLGYLVLGEVVAAVTGEPFTEHVRDRVLGPIGMTHTGFTYTDMEDAPPATRLPAAGCTAHTVAAGPRQ